MNQFQQDIEAFRQANTALLEQGRNLLPQLHGADAYKLVRKPLLLQLIIERELELIEEKLLPALPAPRVAEKSDDEPGSPGLGSESDRSLMVDDFSAFARRNSKLTREQNPADQDEARIRQAFLNTAHVLSGQVLQLAD